MHAPLAALTLGQWRRLLRVHAHLRLLGMFHHGFGFLNPASFLEIAAHQGRSEISRPGVGEAIARREGIVRIDHELLRADDPGPAGDDGLMPGRVADFRPARSGSGTPCR